MNAVRCCTGAEELELWGELGGEFHHSLKAGIAAPFQVSAAVPGNVPPTTGVCKMGAPGPAALLAVPACLPQIQAEVGLSAGSERLLLTSPSLCACSASLALPSDYVQGRGKRSNSAVSFESWKRPLTVPLSLFKGNKLKCCSPDDCR